VSGRFARSTRRIALGFAVVFLGVLPVVEPATGAETLTMDAQALIGGHVRPGAWMAVEVHLTNAGPPIAGELRMSGGNSGRTRYGMTVDLPTESDKRYVLYAQPPAFGRELEVALLVDQKVLRSATVAYQLHEGNQAIIGVVAEDAAGLIASLDLAADQRGQTPALVRLDPTTLPDKVAGWAPLDRLIWQDVDTTSLEPAQVAALRGWLAGGGRLVVIGGTSGPGTLAALPDEILPYRPDSTIDVEPSILAPLLGRIPDGATSLPSLAGTLSGGRPLITSGNRTVAAERTYGLGTTTIVGFDPTVPWIVGTPAAREMWQRLLPRRATSGTTTADDSQILNAVSTVPAIALPPVNGLLALLGGYILLIGPVNYLVLRRLDRREWAWVTMPILTAAFAVGAFAYGAVLRGSDILIHEVAVVRAAPGTSEGEASAYYGVFSPDRATYQIRVPGGALLSAPISGDFFGNPDGSAGALDIVQGDPSRVRDMAVAIGGFRVIRAQAGAAAPELAVEIRVADGALGGAVRNDSAAPIADTAVVLGSTVVRLGDIAPGETKVVPVTSIDATACCTPLSDRLVGQVFSGVVGTTPESQRQSIRHAIVDQLTWDPNFGSGWTLPIDGPVVVAWGSKPVLPVEVEGHSARRMSNALYLIPAGLEVRGTTRFGTDLLRSTVIAADAFFGRDQWAINFGRGTLTMAYRPIPVAGTLAPRRLLVGPGVGPDAAGGEPTESVATIGPVRDTDEPACDVPPCPEPSPAPAALPPAPLPDGIPEIELYDVTTDTWMAFPHMSSGLYEIEDGARYVDPTSGQVLVRFRNEVTESVGFSFLLELEADVR
jgi:hypothetical protein